MKKSDGSWTYFGADAAYHWQKAKNADHLVNIWGADHAGTVKRVQAAVKALTDGRVDLDVKLVQMVRLFRGGEPVKMSKRSGDFVTLAEVVEEVGRDVVRFMMLTRRADAPLDFDFMKVVEASKDNPVFYVQYAHARISSLKRKAADAGVDLARRLTCRFSTKRSWRWSSAPPNIRAWSRARRWRTNRIGSLSIFTTWRPNSTRCGTGATTMPRGASSLKIIHNFRGARLELAMGIAQIIRSGLDLMGVAATEEMR